MHTYSTVTEARAACYSDHDHDIATKGGCDFCGSTNMLVVGEILPQVERIKFTDPVNVARHVLYAKSAKIVVVDGKEILLDTFTASAIDGIYEALSPDGRTKLRSMNLIKAVDVCWKLVNRAHRQA